MFFCRGVKVYWLDDVCTSLTRIYTHAPITPNFRLAPTVKLLGFCSIIDDGPPLFTILQAEMPMDGVRIGRCDQTLNKYHIDIKYIQT